MSFFSMTQEYKILDLLHLVEQKFWKKVIIGDSNCCWLWKGEIDRCGYGKLGIFNKSKKIKTVTVSRLSWIISNKEEIPSGMLVCHKCDNRKCVNPSHLFLGTPKENALDCKNKGRLNKSIHRRKLPYKHFKNDKDRFLYKVEKPAENECWNWKSSIDKTGYGLFRINGKTTFAHRASYALFVGAIPHEMFVCHKCDNRKCVNPNHLFLGTPKDNAQDCSRKKRNIAQTNPEKIRRGESHPNTELTEEIILNIVEDYKSGNYTYKNLEIKYKTKAISHILQGNTWNHITGIIHEPSGFYYCPKPNKELIEKIRENYKIVKNISELARKYQVSRGIIYRIINTSHDEFNTL